MAINDLTDISMDLLHTTDRGADRIRRNLMLDCDDPVAWCRHAIIGARDRTVIRRGKNFYVYIPGCVITINAASNGIITAHKTH